MDIKEYIASGIIEGYVLGTVSDQERREVECMSSIYPELKQHLNEIQLSFEEMVSQMAIEVPKDLKYEILSVISNTEQDVKEIPQQGKAKQEAKIVPMTNQANVVSFWRLIAAACIILLIGTSLLVIDQAMNKSELEKSMANLKKEKKQQEDKAQILTAQMEQRDKKEQFILSKTTQEIHLAGTAKNPEADILVFFNPSQKAAMLSFEGLPKPAQDKQYQMWAMIGGKPVDLGVLDRNPKDKMVMMNLDAILKDSVNITAIAITLERSGGSPTPNMDELFVIGNI